MLGRFLFHILEEVLDGACQNAEDNVKKMPDSHGKGDFQVDFCLLTNPIRYDGNIIQIGCGDCLKLFQQCQKVSNGLRNNAVENSGLCGIFGAERDMNTRKINAKMFEKATEQDLNDIYDQ